MPPPRIGICAATPRAPPGRLAAILVLKSTSALSCADSATPRARRLACTNERKSPCAGGLACGGAGMAAICGGAMTGDRIAGASRRGIATIGGGRTRAGGGRVFGDGAAAGSAGADGGEGSGGFASAISTWTGALSWSNACCSTPGIGGWVTNSSSAAIWTTSDTASVTHTLRMVTTSCRVAGLCNQWLIGHSSTGGRGLGRGMEVRVIGLGYERRLSNSRTEETTDSIRAKGEGFVPIPRRRQRRVRIALRPKSATLAVLPPAPHLSNVLSPVHAVQAAQ